MPEGAPQRLGISETQEDLVLLGQQLKCRLNGLSVDEVEESLTDRIGASASRIERGESKVGRALLARPHLIQGRRADHLEDLDLALEGLVENAHPGQLLDARGAEHALLVQEALGQGLVRDGKGEERSELQRREPPQDLRGERGGRTGDLGILDREQQEEGGPQGRLVDVLEPVGESAAPIGQFVRGRSVQAADAHSVDRDLLQVEDRGFL